MDSNSNREPSAPKKEIPVWFGAIVGLLVVSAVLAVAFRLRSKSTAEPRAPQASSAQASSASADPSLAPIAQPKVVERVVVYPVVHPDASSADGKTTAEREAVDALHSGDLQRAATLYGQLAAAHPDNPALVDAARLLTEATRAR